MWCVIWGNSITSKRGLLSDSCPRMSSSRQVMACNSVEILKFEIELMAREGNGFYFAEILLKYDSMFGRNNPPSNARLLIYGCWSHLSWSGAVAKSIKIISLRLAANTPTVPAQKIDNIELNLTVLVFVVINTNIFNGLGGLFAALYELPF